MLSLGPRFVLCAVTSFSNASNAVKGEGLRVDHVLLGKSMQVKSGSAVTWPDFVRPNVGVDHFPVAVRVLSSSKEL